jgi:hypothetical protein
MEKFDFRVIIFGCLKILYLACWNIMHSLSIQDHRRVLLTYTESVLMWQSEDSLCGVF